MGQTIEEGHMADHTLSVLKVSVNNLPVRVLMRAGGHDVEEVEMWGKKGTPEFLAKDPADLTPLLECEGLPRGSLWESCAIMQYLCNRDGLDQFYPTDPAERAMQDSAMFYVVGTLYPLILRATYPTLGFPQYPGETATSDADDEVKEKSAQDAADAIAMPLKAIHDHFLDGRKFIGGDSPSIADIRLAASLEFLRTIDYEFPTWVEEYMSAVESELGDAYSEPAADVREMIASAKAPA
jgi:glutathione S-transferase